MAPDTKTVIGTIIGTAIALATLIISTTWRMEDRLGNRINAVEIRVGALETRLVGVEKETARMGAIMDGVQRRLDLMEMPHSRARKGVAEGVSPS